MKVVLDPCVLKPATLPNPVNPAALILELCLADKIHTWASPAMIEEYQEVLADHPDLLQRIDACKANINSRAAVLWWSCEFKFSNVLNL